MGHVAPPRTPQDYAALRQTGTSPARARVELDLEPAAGKRLEIAFRKLQARGVGDSQLPKFARHEAHVAAVLEQGGFCAFSERRLGPDGVAICLPLTWP